MNSDLAKELVYLNHAGTSWPKPECVLAAIRQATDSSPQEWPDLFRDSFLTIANFFHVDGSRLLLTPSCTAALNLAVMDLPWEPGDRVLTTQFEHHALYRNLTKLERLGVDVIKIAPANDSLIAIEALQKELERGQVKLVAMTAACNVTGLLLPLREVTTLAHQFDARVLVDGAQVAGWMDLDLIELGVDLFTFAGHKGPQGPWGVGGLYVAEQIEMNCPNASCEIKAAQAIEPFSKMPGYCDAGSVNLTALAGLAAGCRWLNQTNRSDSLTKARGWAFDLATALQALDEVTIHRNCSYDNKLPTVTISLGDRTHQVRDQLKRNKIIASAGFQCAPEAHLALGTQKSGVIRFSFGLEQDGSGVAEQVVNAIRDLN